MTSPSGQHSSANAGAPAEDTRPLAEGMPYPSAKGSAYYGFSPYSGGQYGYGSPAYGGGGITDESDSLLGMLTIGRLIRVCSQRWATILAFAVLGLLGAFAALKLLPTIYEASSVLEMSVRPTRITSNRGALLEGDTVGSVEEVFNTRLARLRSRAMLEQVLQRFLVGNPNTTIAEPEILRILVKETKLALQRRSRLIVVSVRSGDAQLASDLANTYALTAEDFAHEENKAISEEAVAWLKTTVEAQRRKLAQADQAVLDFKIGTQIDAFEKEKEEIGSIRQRVSEDITALESRITMAEEMLNTLQQIQNEPDRFGLLPDDTPRAAEITATYSKLQEQIAERNAMLARYTAKHPDVLVKEKEVEVYRNQFAEVVRRAYETAQANLGLLKSQMEPFKVRHTELVRNYADLQAKIDAATVRLHQLERDLEVNESSYQALLNRMEEARLAHDENTCTIKVSETGAVPTEPVFPKPLLLFPAGLAVGLLLGVSCVLLIDHLEDKVTGLADIEGRLRMKALCILPHVDAKNREEIAFITATDSFAHYSEAFGGLRNLLDSPRYREHTHVMLVISTQPGEGKTVTSTNLALSYATSGQKTLLIDFDLRRPRQARVFKKGKDDFNSLPYVLSANDPAYFEYLPTPSGYANLDLVLSRESAEINPAALMASGIVRTFLDWARERYDRVIIDSPPFGIIGDAVALSTLADSVMIMCCPDRTNYGAINHAVRHLTEAGARVIGVLVNDVDFNRRGFFHSSNAHYRYTYGYGQPYAKRTQTEEEDDEDKTKNDAESGASV